MNRAGCVPDLVVRKRPHFPIDYLVCHWEKEGRSVERVEKVDQKVEWPEFLVAVAVAALGS